MQRVVVVSIVGIDRFAGGYNAAKLAQERAYEDGPIPVRILRAAQFHEFVGQLVDWGRQGDVAHVPSMRTQLVAARTVAEALADLAADPAAVPGPVLEIAGPREESMVEAAKRLMAARGDAGAHRGRDLGPALRGGRRAAGPGRDARGPDVRGVARRGGACRARVAAPR